MEEFRQRDPEPVTDSGVSVNISQNEDSSRTSHQISGELPTEERSLCCSKDKCKDVVKKRIPITKWLPIYKLNYLPLDILAGITVGLTAIPQGIAYAGVAGLPPQYGLYSGIMGCFVYLILGSCKDVNIGPTAIMALMVQPHVEAMGPDGAVLACFLTGCVVFVLGLCQLGFLVDFISYPVVSGFTSAAALTIGSSQLKSLFGIPGKSNDFIPSWKAVFYHITEAKLGDTLLSVGSIIYLVFAKKLGDYGCRRYNPDWSYSRNVLSRIFWIVSLSRNAIVVIFGTFLAWSLDNNGKIPFKVIGNVGEGLPPFELPPFSTHFGNKTFTFVEMGEQLGTTVIFMPLVAILESIAITKAFSRGKSVDATQELIALGFCNIAGSFIRSMSVTGSFTRTALNNASGVKTTLGGIFTALLVILALELLTSTFYYIPKATLAAVIVVAMFYMIDFKIGPMLWRTRKIELLLYLITLIAGTFLGVEYGILIGIATNLLLILYASARPKVDIERNHPNFKEAFIVTPTTSLMFPAAEFVRNKIISHCNNESDVIVDGRFIMNIDVTVAKNIKLLVEDMELRRQNIVLYNFNESVKKCCIDLDSNLGKYFVDGTLQYIKRSNDSAIDIQS